MRTLNGVPCALIARNESWVRRQAQALVRQLPANVERADLIQVGLIAVAQAWLAFDYGGDRLSEAGQAAFGAFARKRVRGAMLDELRQMDYLSRSQRRTLKAIQIARQRWRSQHGSEPGLGQLSALCGVDVDEIAWLEQLARIDSLDEPGDDEAAAASAVVHPATDREEVEARVDTAIVLRRLERFFAELPERERQVIESYLGVGLAPVELAAQWQVTLSRVSQIMQGLQRRLALRLGHAPQRATDASARRPDRRAFDALVTQREAELADLSTAGGWGPLLEEVLAAPAQHFGVPASGRIEVPPGTRWG